MAELHRNKSLARDIVAKIAGKMQSIMACQKTRQV